MIEKPKTIILDNNKQEVRLLIQSLEDKGFDVIHFDKQAEFIICILRLLNNHD